MKIQHRAIQDEQKMERRQEILSAAQKLLEDNGPNLPAVQDIATQAGMAKGTVYLYFKTKEEIFFSLLEIQVQKWLDEIDKVLEGAPNEVSVDQVVSVLYQYVLNRPYVLHLTNIFYGVLQPKISPKAVSRYQRNIAKRVYKGGRSIERVFPTLKNGQGFHLLLSSYALMVGFWQLAEPVSTALPAVKLVGIVIDFNFEKDLKEALSRLWKGSLTP
ncbi:MAG: TetR/AcrR family transcriptional regulator [SAR324 cluster bacterium]|nr:TetR/AcrR family transcriptional regulator [SAR324 cluster bacterium]